MRTFKTSGIIIKRRNVGEADRIVTMFTQGEGKITIKAKGVRKITSKRSPHIELLNYTVATVYKGEGMYVLTEVDTLNSYADVKNDLPRVGIAYHICELIDSLCPEGQEHSQIFTMLEKILDDLSFKKSIGKVVHTFEVELLTNLGYLPRAYDMSGAKASYFIESILERKLKSRQILPHLL